MKILVLLFGFITGLFGSIVTQWGNWLVLRRERGIGFTFWLVLVAAPLTLMRFAGLAALAVFLCVCAIGYGLFATGRAMTPKLAR